MERTEAKARTELSVQEARPAREALLRENAQLRARLAAALKGGQRERRGELEAANAAKATLAAENEELRLRLAVALDDVERERRAATEVRPPGFSEEALFSTNKIKSGPR